METWSGPRTISYGASRFTGNMLAVAVLANLLVFTSGHFFFRDRIPNGHKVPHPCNNDIWMGVGHFSDGGGGPRNPFGLAFHKEGFNWTKKLCQADSDGDGKTNGEELGDPDCTWTPGSKPKSPAIGHPGACKEDDNTCNNAAARFVSCRKQPPCDGRNTTNTSAKIKSLEIRFNPTEVPPTTTNYYCKMFDMPSDGTYHITADRPIIDNLAVMHHMLLYCCPDGVDLSSLEKKFNNTAQPCGMMVQEKCSQIVAGWALGGKGDCYDGLDAAARIGKTGCKRAVLEIHWNNPSHIKGKTDSSGFEIFYSSILRKNDLGVLMIGQNGIKIPPTQPVWDVNAQCMPSCIGSKLRAAKRNDVSIVSVGLHMHLKGKEAYVDLVRPDGDPIPLAWDSKWDYNTPKEFNHYPAIKLRAIDQLSITCIYDTKQQAKHTYYGPSTEDEMCYSYITYYPKIDGFTLCLQYGNTHHCNGSGSLNKVGGCDMSKPALEQTLSRLDTDCISKNGKCQNECEDLLTGTEPCFNYDGDGRNYLEYTLRNDKDGPKYINAIRTCDEKFWKLYGHAKRR